jgi:hypothetical protein
MDGLLKNTCRGTGLFAWAARFAALGGVSATLFFKDRCVHELKVRMGSAAGLTMQQGLEPFNDAVTSTLPPIPRATKVTFARKSITLGGGIGRLGRARGCKPTATNRNCNVNKASGVEPLT